MLGFSPQYIRRLETEGSARIPRWAFLRKTSEVNAPIIWAHQSLP